MSDTFITPSGVPGRLWVSLRTPDGPEESRQLLRITTHGDVLSRTAQWGGFMLDGGLPSLVVSHKQVWDPVENRVVLHLPGDEFDSNQVVAGSDRNRFTWCEGGGFPCQVLHLTDLDAGITRVVAEFPNGDPRFRPEGLSPDGRYLAATICVDDDRLCALAVLDLDANRSWTVAQGWVGLAGITGGSTTPAWSPDGRWVFFQLNDGRLAAYRPGDTEAQVVDVPALDPAIGFAVVSIPHRSE